MSRNGLMVFLCAGVLLTGVFLVLGVNAAIAVILGALLSIFILLRPLLGLVLTIFTNVLSPLLGSFDFSGIGLTLPRAIGAITFVSWLIWLVRARGRLSLRREMLPLAAFFAVVVLSAATKPDKIQSAIGLYMLGVGVLLYALVVTLPQSRTQLLAIVAVIGGMGVISSTIGVIQYIAPGLTVLQMTEGGLDFKEGAVVDEESVSSGPIKRVTGGLGDPNQLGYTLASILPLAMFWWRFESARRYRVLILFVVLLQIAALALSFSRSAVLALACSVLYFTWKRQISLSLLLPAGAVAILAAFIVLPPGFSERMFSFSYLRGGSTSYRKDLLSDTLVIARENWLTGIGYGQLGPMLYNNPRSPYIQDVADQIDLDSPEIHSSGAHNLLLEVWVEYGLLGFVPYMAFLIVLLKELNRLARSPDATVSDLAIAITAGLVAFFVCGVFGHLKLLKVFWLLAGAAACLAGLSARGSGGADASEPPVHRAARAGGQ